MVNNIFNTKKLIQYKNSKIKNWHNHNFIYEKFSIHLLKKLNEIKRNVGNVLLITSDLCETLEQLEKFECKKIFFFSQYDKFLKYNKSNKRLVKIHGLFENISFEKNYFDLVIHNFSLNNLNNPQEHLTNILQFLKKDGLFICNFFGEKNLDELRKSLIITDNEIFQGVFPRIESSLKMVHVVDLLNRIGYKEIVSEVWDYKVFYNNTLTLLEDIRGIGENTVFERRNKGLKTRNYLEKLNQIYKKNFTQDKKIVSTCNIVSLTSWK
jgi:SAM-dependent methyltransferase